MCYMRYKNVNLSGNVMNTDRGNLWCSTHCNKSHEEKERITQSMYKIKTAEENELKKKKS